MSPKELKKLASVCRSAGISTFKNSEVEFTLSDSPPVTKRTQKAKAGNVGNNDNSLVADFVADSFESLTEEQKLFYSTGDLVGTDQ